MNPVKNITISEAKTGFVIIERKFRWPTHANSSNLGSLTESFYQFARAVDEGFIESVVFEGKESHSSSGGGGKPNKQQQSMKMVCCRNEYETVSIYYDTTTFAVDPVDSNNLLLAVQKQFERECGDILSKVGGRIASLVDSVEENSQEVEDIRAHFAFFAQHIDRVITTAFPPALPQPSAVSSSFRDRDRDSSRDRDRDSRDSSRDRDRDRSSKGSSRSSSRGGGGDASPDKKSDSSRSLNKSFRSESSRASSREGGERGRSSRGSSSNSKRAS